MIPTLSWQTPTLSFRVLCRYSVQGTRNERIVVCHDRVGIIFFSGMLGSVWGSSRRLQVHYVISRPGITYHIDSRTKIIQVSHNMYIVQLTLICVLSSSLRGDTYSRDTYPGDTYRDCYTYSSSIIHIESVKIITIYSFGFKIEKSIC